MATVKKKTRRYGGVKMRRSSTTFLRTETLELRGDRASNIWCRKCMPGPVTTILNMSRAYKWNAWIGGPIWYRYRVLTSEMFCGYKLLDKENDGPHPKSVTDATFFQRKFLWDDGLLHTRHCNVISPMPASNPLKVEAW